MNNFNNNSNNKSSQLYPDEAYSTTQTKQENQSNPILPLLLSAMQKDNDNNALLTSLLSGMSGNQEQLIQTLTTSLNKKKKEAKPLSNDEKPFPKNDYIY